MEEFKQEFIPHFKIINDETQTVDDLKIILSQGKNVLNEIQKYKPPIQYNTDVSMKQQYELIQKQLQEKEECIKVKDNEYEALQKKYYDSSKIHKNELLQKEEELRNYYDDRIQNIKNEMNTIKTTYQDELHNKENHFRDELMKQKREIESRTQQDYEEKILSFKKEIQDKYQRIQTLEQNNNTLYQEINQIHLKHQQEMSTKFEEYFKINQQNKEQYEEQLKNQQDEFKKIKEQLEQELQDYKQKYDGIEQNSIHSGAEFENYIYELLSNYLIKNNLPYSLELCSKTNHKGDMILINQESGIRIMVELKSVKNVSNVPNQLPKFYKDLNKEENNYDGGIMICKGKIVGKTDFMFELSEKNRHCCFITDFKDYVIEKVYYAIKILHKTIQISNQKNIFAECDIKNNYIHEYNTFKKLLRQQQNSVKSIEQEIKRIENEFYKMFKEDIEHQNTFATCSTKRTRVKE